MSASTAAPPSLNGLLNGGAASKNVQVKQHDSNCELHGINIKPLKSLEDLQPLWLSIFLNRRIDGKGFKVTPVGTGQMSSTYRVTFHEPERPDETVVVKFASSDKDTRDLGIRFQHYTREAVLYRRFGDLMSVEMPRCYGAVVDDEGWFTMVLEDAGISGGYVNGQLEGTDYEHAALVLKSLARVQAPVLGDSKLDGDEWLNEAGALDQKLFNECLPIFLKRDPPAKDHEKLLYWMCENLDAWYATRVPPFAISHGDFRLDNIIFLEKDNHRAIAVDWGGSNWCSPLRDAAYFLGNGLKIEDRRKWEKQLIRDYVDELNRLSKVKVTWEHAWEEYCRQTIHSLAQHIPAAGILPDTDRGKIVFRTLVERQAQHAIDLGAMSLVKPGMVSYSPDIADECEHVAPEGSGPLWNESWYFDATTADGDLSMYARIGRLPNQDCCSFVGGIFQRGEAPILFVDMKAPLPRSDPLIQRFSADRFIIESECLDPLSKFAFKLKGTGSLYADPSAPLRGADGTDVEDVEMDLVWNTSVNGTIKIGKNIFDLKAVPGERNYNWGVRDWWVADCVWSGLHFEDGTHVFTIALNRGHESTGGADFVQKDGKLVEITKVYNAFDFKDSGLPGKLQLRLEPGDLTIDCETIGAAGLRLIDPEGREAHLPRVCCSAIIRSATNHHGIKGVGWLDFNRVVKPEPTSINQN